MTIGYSGTPLAKKLGIKDGFDDNWSGLKLVIRRENRI